ncbi:MAG TPA: helix-turn-helix transcriptional regulator [Gemmatimonadaceae bacterium]|nr:helix-turn-helix transcriptional regulator [Gemmatimonadaceae bacterium]
MRLRVPELLAEHGLTPYALSRRSGGRISMSTAYRLRENKGVLETYSGELLEALCDVFHIEPGDLLEREKGRKRAK